MKSKKSTLPARTAPLKHSNPRLLLQALGLISVLLLAAWAGAQWQAWRMPATDPALLQAVDSRLLHEQVALQGSIAGLAGKLGALQGRVLAIESLRTRVAEAAGLDYSAPELAPSFDRVSDHPIMDDIPTGLLPAPLVGSAELLGRHIDALGKRLDTQEDAYTLVDAALTQRAGFQASLPTLSPVDYPALSSSFGWRRNPVNGRYVMHEGLDFIAPRGAPIYAASGGLVVRAGTVRGYGRLVEIDHGNGLRTRYAHASSLSVKVGDIVRQGQEVAKVGSSGRSTGDHLHFEVRMADYPLDPSLFIQQDATRRLAQPNQQLAAAKPPAHAPATGLR